MRTRMPYRQALGALDLSEHLRPWPWMIAGTPPLGIEVPGSDIDVICTIDDHSGFAERLAGAFGDARDFHIWQWIGDERNVVCRFNALGWDVEIFGSVLPLARQKAVQHFEIERRLLARADRNFADRVVAAKRSGMKTEPAFAHLLSLHGDPYDALLALHGATDGELDSLLAAANFDLRSGERARAS